MFFMLHVGAWKKFKFQFSPTFLFVLNVAFFSIIIGNTFAVKLYLGE